MTSTGSGRNQEERYDGDATARMRRVLAEVAGGQGSKQELQRAAHDVVTELRLANHPPEQMLLHIKEILGEAGMRPTYAASSEMDGPLGDGATVYRDVIAWSIRSYYDELAAEN